MQPAPTPPEPTPPEPTDAERLAAQRAADVQTARDLLHRVMTMAEANAACIHTQITALPKTPPEPDPAAKPTANPVIALSAAFDEAARNIRLCITLLLRITEPPKQAAVPRAAARTRIIRAVEDVIQREATGEKALSLEYELDERLDLLDADGQITSRPVEELILEILHDLNLNNVQGTRPWKRRTPPEIIELAEWAADPPKLWIPRNFRPPDEPPPA